MFRFNINEINKVASDELLLHTFIYFMFKTVLQFPVTINTINRAIEKNKKALYLRYISLFFPHAKCGYLFFRFLEAIVWLFRNECVIKLDDEKLREAIEYIDTRLLKNEPLNAEENEKVNSCFKLSRYVSNKNVKNEKVLEQFDKFSIEFLDSGMIEERQGQDRWGPFYWAFFHRFAYRLESKLITMTTGNISQLTRNRLKTCFTTFDWLFREGHEILPCFLCSIHYQRENFGIRFSTAIMNKYPYELFRDEYPVEKQLCCLKIFNLRLLSEHLFILHHEHTHSIYRQLLRNPLVSKDFDIGNKHENYTLVKFMDEISLAPFDEGQ